MTHRASQPACGRLLHLDSAVRQLRRRFFPLPPMREVEALPLASTVEWAGGSSFWFRLQPELDQAADCPATDGRLQAGFPTAGNCFIENSANQAVTTSRLGLIFRAHGDRPRQLPAPWRTILRKTE